MSRHISTRLSESWIKAAVAGSLWASFEIIIGSFLHNLRIPFAGTILAFASVALVIGFVQVWKVRGLVWKAGLVAALLKSISPSAIILGPMVGIFSEALIIELFILLMGRNLPAYMLGGAFAVLSALLHKVVSLLVIYGFDLVVIVEQLYRYIIRQLGMEKGDPWLLIGAIVAAYCLAGILAAITGYVAGRRALQLQVETGHIHPGSKAGFPEQEGLGRSSPWMLLFHLACIVLCLYVINTLPVQYSLFPALGYAAFCLFRYKRSMRSFRKPSFWLWFMAITLLAAIFWNGLSKGHVWDLEGLMAGIRMNLRAVVILTGFAALSQELRNPLIRTILYHHGFASVYHSVSLAFSVLPGIIGSLPGVRKIMASPVASLGMIISHSAAVYPSLKAELACRNRVLIITGEVQQGKTGFLMKLMELLTARGIRMKGIIAPGVHDEGGRIGYNLRDIQSGREQVYIRNLHHEGWFRHGKYYFSPEGLAFGHEIFSRIGEENTDLVVVDEVGPVELRGRGWSDDLEMLTSRTKLPMLWVVRKRILKRAIRQWNIGEVLVIDAGSDSLPAILDEILEFLNAPGEGFCH